MQGQQGVLYFNGGALHLEIKSWTQMGVYYINYNKALHLRWLKAIWGVMPYPNLPCVKLRKFLYGHYKEFILTTNIFYYFQL
jgi:hypothetical protein